MGAHHLNCHRNASDASTSPPPPQPPHKRVRRIEAHHHLFNHHHHTNVSNASKPPPPRNPDARRGMYITIIHTLYITTLYVTVACTYTIQPTGAFALQVLPHTATHRICLRGGVYSCP